MTVRNMPRIPLEEFSALQGTTCGAINPTAITDYMARQASAAPQAAMAAYDRANALRAPATPPAPPEPMDLSVAAERVAAGRDLDDLDDTMDLSVAAERVAQRSKK